MNRCSEIGLDLTAIEKIKKLAPLILLHCEKYRDDSVDLYFYRFHKENGSDLFDNLENVIDTTETDTFQHEMIN